MRSALKWTVVVLLLAVVGVTLAYVLAQGETNRERLDEAQQRSDARAADLRELQDVVAEANRRLRAAGRQPVDSDDIPDTPPGLPGLRGPSCIEELGYEECRCPRGFAGRAGAAGREGIDGEDGRSGTPGTDGEDGVNGSDGEDGGQGPAGERGEPGPQGQQGPAGPVGPAGPAGPQGPAGEPGNGCPNTQTITYDDDDNPVTPPVTTTVCVPA